MNKFSPLAAVLFLASLLPSAHATTLGFGTLGAQRTLVDASLNQLAADPTSLVLEGTFASESFTFNPNLSILANYNSIVAAGGWNQFGLNTSTGLQDPGVTTNLGVNASGHLSGSVTDNNSGATEANFFNNKPVYVWVFNGSSPSASTQMGIFRAPSATTPWTFPSNGNGVGDTATLSTTPTNAAVISAIGGAGSTNSSQLILAAVTPVPEPSTFAFGVLGAFAALCSRQRRRKS